MAKAPWRRGRTVATASVGDLPRSTSRATRWATTSLSVSLRNLRPSASSSSRSGLKFSMMPLWTSATGPAMCGWALPTVGAPWVAQRVWAMPIVAGSGSRGQLARQIVELALGPAALELAVLRRCRCRPSHSRDIRAASARRTAAARPLRGRRSRQFRTCYFLSFLACCRARKRAAQPANALLLAARDGQLVGRDILGDHRSRADDRAVADADRRDQRAVRADEGARADLGPIFAEAVVIAGDGARADVGFRADRRVADVAQVIGLGALAERSPSSPRRNCRPWRPRRAPCRAAAARTGRPRSRVADGRALDMAEGADRRAVGDRRRRGRTRRAARSCTSRPSSVSCANQTLSGSIRVAPCSSACLAPAALPVELEMGQLGAAVDAGGLERLALDRHRRAAFVLGDHDDVGKIIFARRIVVADLRRASGTDPPSATAIMPELHSLTARSASFASLYSTILAMRSPSPRMTRP